MSVDDIRAEIRKLGTLKPQDLADLLTTISNQVPADLEDTCDLLDDIIDRCEEQ